MFRFTRKPSSGSHNHYLAKNYMYLLLTKCVISDNVKKVELLKQFKLSKTAPTCFGLQGNHHQGATIIT